VFCLRAIVEVGLKAMRTTMCSPFERPPWIPPDLRAGSSSVQSPVLDV
jgi:hypothetical protein